MATLFTGDVTSYVIWWFVNGYLEAVKHGGYYAENLSNCGESCELEFWVAIRKYTPIDCIKYLLILNY